MMQKLIVLGLQVLQITKKSDAFAMRMSSTKKTTTTTAAAAATTTKAKTKVKGASWITNIRPQKKTTISMPPRSGHVAFQTEEGQHYIFGGYVEEEEETTATASATKTATTTTRYATNDLWRWDDAAVDWIQEVVPNDKQSTVQVPGPRLVSAVAVVDGRPTLFGGWDPQEFGTGGIILDTVHQLDVSTMEWTALDDDVSIPGGPSSRHIAVSISLPLDDNDSDDGSNKKSKNKNKIKNNCALIHNHRCTDHVILFQNGTFRKQPTSGDAPSSRGLHAGTMLDDNRLIVFGGAAQDGKMSNELFVLDLRTWKWTKVAFEFDEADANANKNENKKIPSPRAAPCLASLSDGCVILFGGAEATEQGLKPLKDLWCFEINSDNDDTRISGTWSLLVDGDGDGDGNGDGDSNNIPPPRNAATLMPMEADSIKTILRSEENEDLSLNCSNKKYFLLQGGWAPFVKTWSEPSILSVEM